MYQRHLCPQFHVHEDNKYESTVSGYVQTMPCAPLTDSNYGVFSLDCEMVSQASLYTFPDCIL